MENKRVCIIGAGVSGLATCKQLLERGFLPVVFEAGQTIGGVWTQTMESTRLQTARWEYQFSDFPWPEKVTEDFPDHKQVLEYIEAYAQQFNLLRHVRFGEKVVAVEYVGVSEEEIEAWDLWGGTGTAFGGGRRGVWHVTAQRVDGSLETHIMDFIILCIGQFSELPNIPSFPKNKGPEAFSGKVIHSMDYSNLTNAAVTELVQGKRVTIVGYLKSAVDIAAECANINGTKHLCTMIIRTKRWNLAEMHVWGISLGYLYLSRFSELLLHKPGEGLVLSFVATVLSPLRWFISKLAESYQLRTIPMKKYGMVPEHSFFQAISAGLFCLLPEKFYDKVGEGSILLKPSKSFEFSKDGVCLEGEIVPIKTDVLIYATGFNSNQKFREIFVSPWFQTIVAGTEEDPVPLYRECIHPKIPQMAIIGTCVSVSEIHTSEMRAKWLSCFLSDGFVLPSKSIMEKNIIEWDKYFKRYCGSSYHRNSIICVHIWYFDQLCKDMGCNPRRKKGFFSDIFLPYESKDYAELEFVMP